MQSTVERINDSALILNNEGALDRMEQVYRDGVPPGKTTGWMELDQHFTLPPDGTLNVLTGCPGSGKSRVIDNLMVNLACHHDWNIFYYSPENYPASRHLKNLCQIFIGKPYGANYNGWDQVNAEDLQLFRQLITTRFTFVDCHINAATYTQVLNAIFQECLLKNVRAAVIDPWNKLESQRLRNESETDFIKTALRKIQMFARERGIHFFIVAHPAKPFTSSGEPANITLYSISGSAAWYDMVDNGFVITRSRKDKTEGTNRAKFEIHKIKDEENYGKCGHLVVAGEQATGRISFLRPGG